MILIDRWFNCLALWTVSNDFGYEHILWVYSRRMFIVRFVMRGKEDETLYNRRILLVFQYHCYLPILDLIESQFIEFFFFAYMVSYSWFIKMNFHSVCAWLSLWVRTFDFALFFLFIKSEFMYFVNAIGRLAKSRCF